MDPAAVFLRPGELWVRLAESSSATLREDLTISGHRWTERDGLLLIDVPAFGLEPLLLGLASSLPDHLDTRVLFAPAGQQPTISDYFDVETLDRLSARTQSGWLLELIRRGSLRTVFQPLVWARKPLQVYAYECLMRSEHEGALVGPDRLLAIARGTGLLLELDWAARMTALNAAGAHAIDALIFINFTPTRAAEPMRWIRGTLDQLEALRIAPERIVFEITESEAVEDLDYLMELVGWYRQAGFRVAVDDLGAGYATLNVLHRLRPEYVKIDMALVRDIDRDAYKSTLVAKFLEAARELGVLTVAEGIESPAEAAWFRQQGVDLLQGYLVARPGSPPPLPTWPG
jgi:EAL domain-containing protein (putative c-di-GMP-specific phosphodiesterase class I)